MLSNVNKVQVTYGGACNRRCVYCCAKERVERGAFWNIEQVTKVRNFLHLLNFQKLLVVGGEPGIYPHIWSLIDGFEDRTVVYTNGDFPEFIEACVKRGVHQVSVSLHGPNFPDVDPYIDLSDSITFSMLLYNGCALPEEGLLRRLLNSRGGLSLNFMEPVKRELFDLSGTVAHVSRSRPILSRPLLEKTMRGLTNERLNERCADAEAFLTIHDTGELFKGCCAFSEICAKTEGTVFDEDGDLEKLLNEWSGLSVPRCTMRRTFWCC